MITVFIEPSAWHAVLDDRSWLKAELVVDGVAMHVDAVAVGSDATLQRIAGDLGEALDRLREALGSSGPWSTVQLGDRAYVLVATPFCS